MADPRPPLPTPVHPAQQPHTVWSSSRGGPSHSQGAEPRAGQEETACWRGTQGQAL